MPNFRNPEIISISATQPIGHFRTVFLRKPRTVALISDVISFLTARRLELWHRNQTSHIQPRIIGAQKRRLGFQKHPGDPQTTPDPTPPSLPLEKLRISCLFGLWSRCVNATRICCALNVSRPWPWSECGHCGVLGVEFNGLGIFREANQHKFQTTTIIPPWSPWLYQLIKHHEDTNIRKIILILLVLPIQYFSKFFVWIAVTHLPELIRIRRRVIMMGLSGWR